MVRLEGSSQLHQYKTEEERGVSGTCSYLKNEEICFTTDYLIDYLIGIEILCEVDDLKRLDQRRSSALQSSCCLIWALRKCPRVQ